MILLIITNFTFNIIDLCFAGEEVKRETKTQTSGNKFSFFPLLCYMLFPPCYLSSCSVRLEGLNSSLLLAATAGGSKRNK